MTSPAVKDFDLTERQGLIDGAVAYLPTPLRRRVQRAEPRIRLTDTWGAAAELALQTGGGVVIADPTTHDGATGKSMVELCHQLPSLVPVAFARLTLGLVAHLRRLARFEFFDVILVDYDDTPRRFVELADLAQATSLTGSILQCLEPTLLTAGPEVRHAVRDLFRSPRRYPSVSDLAAAVAMPKRSLYRNIEAVGLSSPRLLITASRVVRAIGLLRDPHRTLRDVARRLGYANSELLAEHILLFTGLRVRDVRRADLTVLASTIAARLTLSELRPADNLSVPASAPRILPAPITPEMPAAPDVDDRLLSGSANSRKRSR